MLIYFEFVVQSSKPVAGVESPSLPPPWLQTLSHGVDTTSGARHVPTQTPDQRV